MFADRAARRCRRSKYETLESRVVLDSTVVLNEVLYHDAGTSEQEWIELHNQMAVDMDLSGWSLRDAVDFEFPNGTVIPGGGYLVVARDPAALSNTSGLAGVLGPISGRLANSGETIRLINNSGRIMDELDYGDQAPWPVGADGSGATLAKSHPLLGTDRPENWRASDALGGTPGQVNFPTGPPPRVSLDLIDPQSSTQIHVPTNDTLGTNWTSLAYEEGSGGEAWSTAATSVGYDAAEAMDYQAAVLADNPLLYWRMTQAAPAAPAENLGLLGMLANGQYSPDANLNAPSLVGQFDDTSIAVTQQSAGPAARSEGFEKQAAHEGIGGDGRSLEFWLQLDSLPSSVASLVGDGEGALDFGFMVYLTAEGQLQALLRTTHGSNFGITILQTVSTMPLNETLHVVATWDQPTGQIAIYVNGQPVETTLVDGALPNTAAPRNTANQMFVGKDLRNAGSLQAAIDEVALFNYAISPSQIATHFAAGGATLGGLIQTDVAPVMQSQASSLYVRAPFELPTDVEPQHLQLSVRYDDGFIAYLNGIEVARRNAPAQPNFASQATVSRNLAESMTIETIDLSASMTLLNPGDNLLAIHALNDQADDGTFLIQTQLTASGLLRPADALPTVEFSELSGGSDAELRVELQNHGTTPLSLNGLVIVHDGEDRREYVLPNLQLAAGGYQVFRESQLGFKPADGDRLYLLTSDRQRLIDAVGVTPRTQARSPEYAGEWLAPSLPTFGSPNVFSIQNQIVINEIMYHAPPASYAQPQTGNAFTESDEEWVELYHRGTTPVDVSGWQLSDAVRFTFPQGTVLQPGDFLVLASDPGSLRAKHPEIAASIVGPYAGRLDNSHERLRLLDEHANPVDEVHYYDGGRWSPYADGGGSSLELIDPDADNSVAESWAASDESLRSEWQTYLYRGPAERPSRSNFPVTFNELSFGLLEQGEFLIDDIQVTEAPDTAPVTFIQNADFTAGLATWRPVGNHHGQIVADPTDPTNTVLHVVATGPEEHLQNHVETTLRNGDTYERVRRGEEYEITFRAKWLAGSPQLNTRMFFNYLPRTTILQTPTRHGTPGAPNSRRVENAGPTYQGLRHEPVSPTANEPVTVSVDARDADGVARLAVLYRVNEGPLQTVEMTRASGDRFFGTIPGQAAGQQVQFYVRGTDTLNAISHFPAAAEDSRAMYVVGERTLSTSGLHNLQIIMTGSDEQLLGARTNLMSNDRLGATVIYQDQVFYDVGIRLKGSEHGRPDPNRRGFSLEFAPDQLFRGVHSTVSIDRSGGWRFGRTFGQDEILIYHFFNRAGNVPSMYSDLIFVDGPTVPASTAILQMSRYNSVYLDSQYENGSDGTAYEYELIYAMQESSGPESLKAAQEGPSVVGIPVGTDLGDEAEFYRHYFLIKNNRAKDDYQPIMRLAKALSARSSEFDAATQEVMDVDQWMRAFAALSLSGANDNYNANAQHNAIFYERPSDGKMLLFPFDMDFAFILSPTAPLSSNTDLTRLLLNPTNRHAFLGHLHDIVSTSFNRDYMQSWVEHYDRLLPGQNLSSILGWIEQRAAHVLRQLPPQVSFVVAAEQQTASSPLAVIEGEGWVNVRQIRLAGSDTPLPVRWLDDRRWQATVPVSADSQTLELHAFDFGDNPIGSQTVVITRRLGDVSGDQAVNASDIDLLCAQIHSGDYDPRFDLYADGRIDLADQQVLIRDVLKTVEGDTNLDGIFNSSDLVAAFVRGGYEDDQPQNSGWASGDWNCDGEFNSRDFVVAFQRGGYVAAAIDTTTLGRARATAHGYVP